MMIVIRNGEVYSPEYIGKKDLLIAGEKIIAIADYIDISTLNVEVKEVFAEGHLIVPGFIDSHVHIIGGGGEGGFMTRTPELMLTQATKAGVTTIVGVIGTDGTTRTMPDLIAKARGLEEEGITCYVHTGSYQIPVKSLTGSIQSDLILIDKIIGVGEVAIADHRSSQPTVEELSRIASEARVGGMLAGKSGAVNIHVGDGDQKLSLLEQVIKTTDIPISQFIPTHINRNQELFQAGVEYAKNGGYVDFTTSTIKQFLEEGETKCSKALKTMLDAGVDLRQISFTSDAQGSLPAFDSDGKLIGLKIGDISSLFNEVRDAVLEESIPLEQAVQVITVNPANALKLKGKGEIKTGYDADLVLLTKDLEIKTVIARGQLMIEDFDIKIKGTFE
ncbi:beta-aspartyl-peptidase [Halalkalibacter akibai]|uniref:Isoaspartyl dipeptidase n=1 Tax=Halalkalibacter akibai (strain ATCC 43226 / DSM 21942 / CIP 109018 / JCM 9157 / 1139) TaxID=1236973 RepID=W4QU88_HALA3|nr:beta-aspartyl-peptidase [Halalkalibacter akibai]GAE35646.1 isoaspartyl dipeptidase [Halalkalibacter akibai JCM 9157]